MMTTRRERGRRRGGATTGVWEKKREKRRPPLTLTNGENASKMPRQRQLRHVKEEHAANLVVFSAVNLHLEYFPLRRGVVQSQAGPCRGMPCGNSDDARDRKKATGRTSRAALHKTGSRTFRRPAVRRLEHPEVRDCCPVMRRKGHAKAGCAAIPSSCGMDVAA